MQDGPCAPTNFTNLEREEEGGGGQTPSLILTTSYLMLEIDSFEVKRVHTEDCEGMVDPVVIAQQLKTGSCLRFDSARFSHSSIFTSKHPISSCNLANV